MTEEHKSPLSEREESPGNVDIWMIRENLRLTYEERVAQHQDTIDCIRFLNGKGSKRRARPDEIPGAIQKEKEKK